MESGPGKEVDNVKRGVKTKKGNTGFAAMQKAIESGTRCKRSSRRSGSKSERRSKRRSERDACRQCGICYQQVRSRKINASYLSLIIEK